MKASQLLASQRRPAWLFDPKPLYHHIAFPARRILITGGSGGVATEIFDPAQNLFVAGPPMNAARENHVAVPLGNGLVLAAGGLSITSAGGSYTASAELYTGTGFQPIGNMTAVRAGAVATVLYSGRVLIVGGVGSDGNNPAAVQQLASAEYLETVCASDFRYRFVRTMGGMAQGRGGHTATAFLRSPLVLVAGGYDGGADGITASAEVYDQPQDTFTSITPMRQRRMFHAACLLKDGRILVCGGTPDNMSDAVLASAETFDPRAQGSYGFSSVGDMVEGRETPTATLLDDGRVLVAGGFSANGHSLSSAELFDPVSNSFAATGSMHTGRAYHVATPLGDGRVLVTGGKPSPSIPATASAEIYDPTTGQFTQTAPMSVARLSHGATPI